MLRRGRRRARVNRWQLRLLFPGICAALTLGLLGTVRVGLQMRPAAVSGGLATTRRRQAYLPTWRQRQRAELKPCLARVGAASELTGQVSPSEATVGQRTPGGSGRRLHQGLFVEELLIGGWQSEGPGLPPLPHGRNLPDPQVRRTRAGVLPPNRPGTRAQCFGAMDERAGHRFDHGLTVLDPNLAREDHEEVILISVDTEGRFAVMELRAPKNFAVTMRSDVEVAGVCRLPCRTGSRMRLRA